MAGTIFACIEQRDGRINRVSWETLAAAQELSSASGWRLRAVMAGSGIASLGPEIAAQEISSLTLLESPRLSPYTPDGYAYAFQKFFSSNDPALVLMPHTYQVRDFAPKLATALGRPLVSDCTALRMEGEELVLTRSMFQGKFSADVTPEVALPWLATIQSGAYRGDQVRQGAQPAPVETETLEIPAEVIRTQPEEPFQEAKQAVDLTQAEIIVAVGRGIKEEKNIVLARQLADALGAELAASRPICDSGWLPMDRQIGSSGQTVAPKLYFALGISGAIQHIVGMKGSRAVVAVNKDAEAPIFEVADVAVVANLFDIVPPLVEAIKKIRNA